ncbi:hypothetical protein ASPWEDRAFT_42611 [Aspergillus wentii DTO 134E9]|uniref:Uncharacterized protein n=1 Tax=Aspergillus wentii DTO 134E9 TaxID=1073089 RepID=A0A1L9RCE5_ASPWE|nr:uncharacterized protein ASPWEDRAFT_42611 [Aspergillus wentii DTO 134E9]OJJ32595.1 hypothetical protein ASPWEDRAFT_42611 [Aspergillus wentii DTO 134E9]
MVSPDTTALGGETFIFPPFDELPLVPGQPQGCLWGFLDRNGNKDELGSMDV